MTDTPDLKNIAITLPLDVVEVILSLAERGYGATDEAEVEAVQTVSREVGQVRQMSGLSAQTGE